MIGGGADSERKRLDDFVQWLERGRSLDMSLVVSLSAMFTPGIKEPQLTHIFVHCYDNRSHPSFLEMRAECRRLCAKTLYGEKFVDSTVTPN